MELFEYRDPVFGLIVLFAVLLLVSLMSYVWGTFSLKHSQKSLENIVKRFENGKASEVGELLGAVKPNLNLLLAFALTLQKTGDFEKAIAVYLFALKETSDQKRRQELLVLLGKTHLKAGFFKRAEDLFLESLKISARDDEALRQLGFVYEKLRQYDKSLEVLDALKELGEETNTQHAYVNALKIVASKFDFAEKSQKLLLLAKEFTLIKRMLIELYTREKRELDFDLPPLDMCADLLYFAGLDSNEWNTKAAKCLNENGFVAKVEFSFVCDECKAVSPLFSYRCGQCARLGSVKVKSKIVKEENDRSYHIF